MGTAFPRTKHSSYKQIFSNLIVQYETCCFIVEIHRRYANAVQCLWQSRQLCELTNISFLRQREKMLCFAYFSWRRVSFFVWGCSACIHSLHNCSLRYFYCNTWAKYWRGLCRCLQLPSLPFPCTCAVWVFHWHLPHTAISGRKICSLKICPKCGLSMASSSNLSDIPYSKIYLIYHLLSNQIFVIFHF